MVIEADKSANVAVQRYGRNNLVHWASTPLCIEFTYTLEDRWSNQGKELFNSFADLVRLVQRCGPSLRDRSGPYAAGGKWESGGGGRGAE